MRRLQSLARQFVELQDDDAALPVGERTAVGLVLGMREFDLAMFRPLKRNPDAPVEPPRNGGRRGCTIG